MSPVMGNNEQAWKGYFIRRWSSQTVHLARRGLAMKRMGRTPMLVLCSRNVCPEKGLVRRPHVDQHGG